MLSFRDGRCDAKDGVATDRQSLLPSELGSQGTRGSLGERQRYVVRRGCRIAILGTVVERVLFPVTRVKWPAWPTVAAGGSGAVKINRMAWQGVASYPVVSHRAEPRAVLDVIHPHASRGSLRERLWAGRARKDR